MRQLKWVLKNILFINCYTLAFYLIIYNIFISMILMTTSIYVQNIYYLKKVRDQQQKKLDFQVNTFIKNMAINSLANNFNIIDAIDKSLYFIEGCLKKDLIILKDEIKLDYNYQKAFDNLRIKYQNNPLLNEFINNLLIIKEQSNIDQSARKIFEITSKDSQKHVIIEDRRSRIKQEHFKNYLINLGLGYIICLLIISSLNSYYYIYASSFKGILINSIVIFISQIMTIYFINKTFKREEYEI